MVYNSKARRNELLQELAARLERDDSLKNAVLEVKNQRLRMQNGSKRLIESSKQVADDDESESTAKGFTFNMNAEDDGDDDDDMDGGQKRTSGESKKWKPKLYKWKFERSR